MKVEGSARRWQFYHIDKFNMNQFKISFVTSACVVEEKFTKPLQDYNAAVQ